MRAPGFGHRRIQHLGDLAAFCGGTVIAEEAGLTLEDVRAEHFGTARRVIVTADSTAFIEGGGAAEAVGGRLQHDPRRAGAGGPRARRRDPPGADRPARDEPRRDPRGRGHRRGPQRALPAHRGRAGRHAGGGRRGDRAGRRHGAAAQRRGRSTRCKLEGDYARGVEVVRSVLTEPLYWIASNAGYDGQAAIDQVSRDAGRPRARRPDRRVRRPLREGRSSTRCGSRGSASSTRHRWRRSCSRPRRWSPRS